MAVEDRFPLAEDSHGGVFRSGVVSLSQCTRLLVLFRSYYEETLRSLCNIELDTEMHESLCESGYVNVLGHSRLVLDFYIWELMDK